MKKWQNRSRFFRSYWMVYLEWEGVSLRILGGRKMIGPSLLSYIQINGHLFNGPFVLTQNVRQKLSRLPKAQKFPGDLPTIKPSSLR